MQFLEKNTNKNAFLLFAQVDKNTNTLKPWLHCHRFSQNCVIVILNFSKRQCGSWMAHLCFCCFFLTIHSPSLHNSSYNITLLNNSIVLLLCIYQRFCIWVCNVKVLVSNCIFVQFTT